MKKIIILSITFFAQSIFAEQELIVGIGKGMDDTLIQSRSISSADQWEVSWAYNLDKPFSNEYGYWQWWVQAGYIHLDGVHEGLRQQLNIVQLKPILRLFPGGESSQFFFEAGLGAAKLSKKKFEQITVKTKGNFSVHFAAGWRWTEDLRLSLRYSHFSNGYTHTPNPGIDTLSLNFHWAFK